LGWSHGDDEIMSTEQMIEWFDIDGINRGAARFDFAKLESVNAHYLRAEDNDTLFARLIDALPHLPDGEAFRKSLDESRMARLRHVLPLLKERAKTLNDLVDGAAFLVTERPLSIDK